MIPEGAKRFYESAEVQDLEDAFGVALDGRAVRTPGGSDLRLPSRPLAEAVAAEWHAQDETVRPATMAMMQLACTAIDRVMPHRNDIVGQTAAYGATDLLCYRAETPDELVARQARVWQPLLDWAAEALAAPLDVGAGVIHVEQPEASLAALRAALEAMDDWRLTGVAQLTQVLGSLVLALALAEGRLDWQRAFEASVLDETFQAERWGEDREARQRLQATRHETRAAATFLALLAPA